MISEAVDELSELFCVFRLIVPFVLPVLPGTVDGLANGVDTWFSNGITLALSLAISNVIQLARKISAPARRIARPRVHPSRYSTRYVTSVRRYSPRSSSLPALPPPNNAKNQMSGAVSTRIVTPGGAQRPRRAEADDERGDRERGVEADTGRSRVVARDLDDERHDRDDGERARGRAQHVAEPGRRPQLGSPPEARR